MKLVIICIAVIVGMVISTWYSYEIVVLGLVRRAIIKRIDDLDQRMYKLEVKYNPIKSIEMFNNIIDEEFALWAFGDVWHMFLVLDCDSKDLMHAWNDLHGDIYRLEDTDIISESMDIMKEIYEQHMEGKMDKKMHKVTESIKVAEKDIKKGKPPIAVKTLKGAEKKNEKLVKIDRDVRDPIIDKTKKLCKEVGKRKN